jgi:hypothetical protein
MRRHADQYCLTRDFGSAVDRLAGIKCFVAYDAFQTGFINPSERVAVSTNNSTTFAVDNPNNNGPQVGNSINPGMRIATDSTGKVYSIFGVGSPTATPGVNNVTYYLNRSSNGGVTWTSTQAARSAAS